MQKIECIEYLENHMNNIKRLEKQEENIQAIIFRRIFIGLGIYILLNFIPELINITMKVMPNILLNNGSIGGNIIIIAILLLISCMTFLLFIAVCFAIREEFKVKKEKKENIDKLKKRIKHEKKYISSSKEIIAEILSKDTNIIFEDEDLEKINKIIYNTPELLNLIKKTKNIKLKNSFIDYLNNKNKNKIINNRIDELINNNIKIES